MQWAIIKSESEIIEYIDNALGDFNKNQVNYNSKMDYLPLNFHIKDEADNIIAGINAFACWQMLWLNDSSSQFRVHSFIWLLKITHCIFLKDAHGDTGS